MRPEDFEPPNLPTDASKIVFDEDVWHPLDHRIGDARCRTFQRTPGAALRTHWRYQWDFGPWRHRLAILHKLTGCWWGRHNYQTWWRTERDNRRAVFHRRVCEWCGSDDPDVITAERIE